MICQVCGTEVAVAHVVETDAASLKERWYCAHCAAERGIRTDSGGSEIPDGFVGPPLDLLAETERLLHSGVVKDPPCPACGRTVAVALRTGLLGCPLCYEVFREWVHPLLRRHHGRTGHAGRIPTILGPNASHRREIARLASLLDDAVAREAYEQAAAHRDEIRRLQREIDELGAAGGAERVGRVEEAGDSGGVTGSGGEDRGGED